MPEAPTATAPAPAKEQAPVAAPESKPASAPEEKPASEWMGDVEAELSSMDEDAPKPAKKESKPKPQSSKSPESDQGQAEKPKKEVPAPESVSNPEDSPEPGRMNDVRTWGRNAVKAAKQLRKEKAELENRISEFESQSGKAEPLTKELDSLRKRNSELEQHIRYVDYTKSAEFQDKYHKPYVDAFNRALSDFSQLTVKVKTGQDEDGNATYEQRAANVDDLLYLANLKLGEMMDRSEEMFGRSAPLVMRHVEKVRELAQAQQDAVQKAQKDAADHEQLATSQNQEQSKQKLKLWKEANEHLAKKYPKWFAPEEGDDEGNEALRKGFALADSLFSPTNENQPKSVEEAVMLHARMRNRIANHDRLVLKLKRANDQIAELESELEQFRDSEPSSGKGADRKSGGEKSYMESAEDELNSLDEQI